MAIADIKLFKEYHRNNPHIYKAFCRFALEAGRAGRTRFAAMMVIQRIRWYTQVETKGDEFKINNNYAPAYARLFARDRPRMATLFKMRTSKFDGVTKYIPKKRV